MFNRATIIVLFFISVFTAGAQQKTQPKLIYVRSAESLSFDREKTNAKRIYSSRHRKLFLGNNLHRVEDRRSAHAGFIRVGRAAIFFGLYYGKFLLAERI